MIKGITPTLVCCTLLLGNIAKADSELNRCLETNKASENRFEICYGQLVDRKVSKRKSDFQERFRITEEKSAAEAEATAAAEAAKNAAPQIQTQPQPQRYAPAEAPQNTITEQPKPKEQPEKPAETPKPQSFPIQYY